MKVDKDYVTISIGNTDNKLTQKEWSEFVAAVNEALKDYGKIHFFGGSPNWEPWQNVAWIVEYSSLVDRAKFITTLESIREQYKQDSIFILRGSGEFI